MTTLAAALAAAIGAILCALSALHALWAMGIWWPAHDERRLVTAVAGFRDVTRMPGPIPSGLLAAGLLLAAAWPWLVVGWLADLGLVVAASAFAIRGLLPWRPFWREMTPQEPFATLDRRAYGPPCLALAAGIGALAIGDVE